MEGAEGVVAVAVHSNGGHEHERARGQNLIEE